VKSPSCFITAEVIPGLLNLARQQHDSDSTVLQGSNHPEADMLRKGLIGSAATLLAVLCFGPTLFVHPAQAITLTRPSRWAGSATCIINVTDLAGYHDQQTQTWTIPFAAVATQQGAMFVYPYLWTDNGGGRSADGRVTWTTNGHSGGAITFGTPGSTVVIQLVSSATRDPMGLIVTDTTTNPPRTTYGTAYEWQFTPPAITAFVGTTDVQAPYHAVPIVGSIGWQRPGDATESAMCAWHFYYGSSLPPPLVITPHPKVHP